MADDAPFAAADADVASDSSSEALPASQSAGELPVLSRTQRVAVLVVLGSGDGRNALAASVRQALERKVRLTGPAVHAGRSRAAPSGLTVAAARHTQLPHRAQAAALLHAALLRRCDPVSLCATCDSTQRRQRW